MQQQQQQKENPDEKPSNFWWPSFFYKVAPSLPHIKYRFLQTPEKKEGWNI